MALIYRNNIIHRLTQTSQHPLSQAMVIRAVRAVPFWSTRQWLEDVALCHHVPLYYLMPLGVLVEVKGFRVVCDETASAGDGIAVLSQPDPSHVVSTRETVGAQIYIRFLMQSHP